MGPENSAPPLLNPGAGDYGGASFSNAVSGPPASPYSRLRMVTGDPDGSDKEKLWYDFSAPENEEYRFPSGNGHRYTEDQYAAEKFSGSCRGEHGWE